MLSCSPVHVQNTEIFCGFGKTFEHFGTTLDLFKQRLAGSLEM